MNDFTLEELAALVDVFTRASIRADETVSTQLQQRLQIALAERQELEDLDFDDCLSCKL
jgi:hypothetical protein